METANRVAWWRQFRVGVLSGIPFLPSPRAETEAESEAESVDEASDEASGEALTEEEEKQLAQMVSFLDRLFPFVKPSPTFRTRLKQALLAEHRRRLASGAQVPAPQEGGISWRWSLAATVPLLIGVLATILWRRSHRSDEQLASLIGGQ